ncbi:MAG: hypothetical protein ACPG7F_02075 [Aggregatilineales bacterium]
MTHDSWDAVFEQYETIYIHTRYATHANAMLDLIPRLQADDSFANCTPIITHATLCLQIEDSPVQICIWANNEQDYQIYLYNPETGTEHDKIVVDGDNAINMLKAYSQKVAVPEP